MESSVVPDSAVDAVRRTLAAMEAVQSHLTLCLSLAQPEVIDHMAPLQRAQLYLTLAKSTAAVFSVGLRCRGIDPDEHPVKREIERIQLFEEKLQRYYDWNKAPIRPSTTINSQAATRFIAHSLPDLTAAQKQGMRDISRGHGVRNRVSEKHVSKKKRKYQTAERQSARTAAAEFLEKAAKEILGPNAGGMKGPLQFDTSNEQDTEMT